MFKSAENLIFNGVDVADRFFYDGGYFIVNDVRGRTAKSVRLSTIVIPGRHGSIARGRDIESRTLEIDYTLKGASADDLRARLEELHRLLIVDGDAPMQFNDEYDRTYYGRLAELSERLEVGNIHQGTLTILCAMPFKYSPAKTYDFTNGIAVIHNAGVTEAKPVVRATVLNDITYMDVFTATKYMRIGRPVEVGESVNNRFTRVLNDSLTTLVGWSSTGLTVDGGDVAGEFTVVNDEFVASSYGTGSTWHGPAVKKSVPNAPLVDFEVEYRLKFPTVAGGLGRIELYLLDDQSQTIGKLSMKKITQGFGGNTVEVRLGNGLSSHMLINYAGSDNKSWDNFNGIIRLSRIGNVWTAYIARIDPNTAEHIVRYGMSYTDTELLYANNLSQVQFHVAQNGTSVVPKLAIANLTVDRINNTNVTDPNIIARAGDVIEINYQSALVTINGEPRPEIKDFGSQFFGIPKGRSSLTISPSESLVANATFEEAFL